MSIETLNISRSRFARERTYVWWVPATFLLIGLPLGAWSVLIQGGGSSHSVPFGLETGWFVLLAVGYLGLHGLRGMAWGSAQVLLTIEALTYFVAVPVWRFATREDQVDSGYTHAMWLVLIGFTAFWVGSLILLKDTEMRFAPRIRNTTQRVAFVSAAMFGTGVLVKLLMWRAGLFSYLADPGVRAASQGFLQWLGILANLLNGALVVSAIEIFGKQSREPLIRIVFGLSLMTSLGFGVISGMKGEIVQPVLFVVLVYGIVKGRLPRTAILLPVLLAIFIYPFVEAYRHNLSQGYGAQVNTLGGLQAALVQSFDDAFLSFGSESEQAAQSSSQATRRMSYLTNLRDVVELPDPSALAGDETIWLAPIYPLVPRYIWKTKPVMDEGVRFAMALGSRGGTSEAMTPIGDLYARYEAYGVVLGMFIYGLCLQGYMNWRGGQISESGLFIHISMLITFLYFEGDFVGTIGREIQMFLVAIVTAYVIYGRQASAVRVRGAQ